jgi:hypothetical protein
MRTLVVVVATLVSWAAFAESTSGSPDTPVGAYQISAAGDGAGVWRLDTRTGALSYCWARDIAEGLALVAEDAAKGDPFAAMDASIKFGLRSDRMSKEELEQLAAAKKAARPLPSVLVISCSSGRQ